LRSKRKVSAAMQSDVIEGLRLARAAEKEQSLYYRGLSAQAEDGGHTDAAERLSALHADEQHHFARLTARLNELGEDMPELTGIRAPSGHIEDWEPAAREREQLEIDRYRALLALDLDAQTRALLEGVLEVETHHHENLAGKWTQA
jgi:rubrerythrin